MRRSASARRISEATRPLTAAPRATTATAVATAGSIRGDSVGRSGSVTSRAVVHQASVPPTAADASTTPSSARPSARVRATRAIAQITSPMLPMSADAWPSISNESAIRASCATASTLSPSVQTGEQWTSKNGSYVSACPADATSVAAYRTASMTPDQRTPSVRADGADGQVDDERDEERSEDHPERSRLTDDRRARLQLQREPRPRCEEGDERERPVRTPEPGDRTRRHERGPATRTGSAAWGPAWPALAIADLPRAGAMSATAPPAATRSAKPATSPWMTPERRGRARGTLIGLAEAAIAA